MLVAASQVLLAASGRPLCAGPRARSAQRRANGPRLASFPHSPATTTIAVVAASASSAAVAASSTSSPPNQSLSLFSPSKINLFLRITARRPDGFHDLASLFHVIDLGEKMTFEELGEGVESDELLCDAEGVPTDASNLALKALALFRSKMPAGSRDARRFFRVTLEKKVPHGAGLGGGSANAATALWAANEAAGKPATDAQLAEWGGEIGSDISVFFSKGAAYCTGRGEIVENVDPPLPLGTPMLLVKPPAGLATPAVFKALDLASRSAADPLSLSAGLKKSKKGTRELCVNDLEPPAFSIMPELEAVKERLSKEPGVDASFMTGSGSTVVALGGGSVSLREPLLSPPSWFLEEEQYKDWFSSPARLIAREEGEWYRGPDEE